MRKQINHARRNACFSETALRKLGYHQIGRGAFSKAFVHADAPDVVLPKTSVTYYAERMFSIMVDPGEALQPGRSVELVLLPGIKDIDGLTLGSSENPRVLKWTVRSVH